MKNYVMSLIEILNFIMQYSSNEALLQWIKREKSDLMGIPKMSPVSLFHKKKRQMRIFNKPLERNE